MNIMLVSVTERTKEIGLKKAIGARKKVILGQFLTEAAVLTSVGGIIGVVLGIGLSKVVSKVAGSPTAISVPAIIGSVVFSMLIGIIFGLLPSVKAANLNPIGVFGKEWRLQIRGRGDAFFQKRFPLPQSLYSFFCLPPSPEMPSKWRLLPGSWRSRGGNRQGACRAPRRAGRAG